MTGMIVCVHHINHWLTDDKWLIFIKRCTASIFKMLKLHGHLYDLNIIYSLFEKIWRKSRVQLRNMIQYDESLQTNKQKLGYLGADRRYLNPHHPT